MRPQRGLVTMISPVENSEQPVEQHPQQSVARSSYISPISRTLELHAIEFDWFVLHKNKIQEEAQNTQVTLSFNSAKNQVIVLGNQTVEIERFIQSCIDKFTQGNASTIRSGLTNVSLFKLGCDRLQLVHKDLPDGSILVYGELEKVTKVSTSQPVPLIQSLPSIAKKDEIETPIPYITPANNESFMTLSPLEFHSLQADENLLNKLKSKTHLEFKYVQSACKLIFTHTPTPNMVTTIVEKLLAKRTPKEYRELSFQKLENLYDQFEKTPEISMVAYCFGFNTATNLYSLFVHGKTKFVDKIAQMLDPILTSPTLAQTEQEQSTQIVNENEFIDENEQLQRSSVYENQDMPCSSIEEQALLRSSMQQQSQDIQKKCVKNFPRKSDLTLLSHQRELLSHYSRMALDSRFSIEIQQNKNGKTLSVTFKAPNDSNLVSLERLFKLINRVHSKNIGFSNNLLPIKKDLNSLAKNHQIEVIGLDRSEKSPAKSNPVYIQAKYHYQMDKAMKPISNLLNTKVELYTKVKLSPEKFEYWLAVGKQGALQNVTVKPHYSQKRLKNSHLNTLEVHGLKRDVDKAIEAIHGTPVISKNIIIQPISIPLFTSIVNQKVIPNAAKENTIIKIVDQAVTVLLCSNSTDRISEWEKYILFMIDQLSREKLTISTAISKLLKQHKDLWEKEHDVIITQDDNFVYIDGSETAPLTVKNLLSGLISGDEYITKNVYLSPLAFFAKQPNVPEGVSVKENSKKRSISIQGKRIEVEEVVEIFKKWEKSLLLAAHRTTIQVTTGELSQLISSSMKQVKKIEEDCKVSIQLETLHNIGYSVIGGIRIDLCYGNIIHSDCDALVSAANSDLEHSGGIAKTIADAAGEEMIAECKRYGKLMEGKAMSTTAGKLGVNKYIIHTVGPVWKGGTFNEQRKLVSAVKEALLIAESLSVESIAIPAVSSGNFGYPLADCLKTICLAVKHSIPLIPKLKRIQLVANPYETCKEWIVAMKTALSNYTQDSALPGVERGPVAHKQTVCNKYWFWKDDENKWTRYKNDTCVEIQDLYDSNVNLANISIGGKNYEIDFKRKVQRNLVTGFEHQITQDQPMESFAEWFWIDDQNQPSPYSVENCALIEKAYQSKKPSISLQLKRHADDLDSQYEIHFSPAVAREKHYKFYQIRVQTNFARGVERHVKARTATINIPQDSQSAPVAKPQKTTVVIHGRNQNIELAKTKLQELTKSLYKTRIAERHVSKEFLESMTQSAEFKEVKFEVVQGKLEISGLGNVVDQVYQAILEHLVKHNTSVINTPQGWCEQEGTLHIANVTQGSKEWNTVADRVHQTLSCQIVKIERIQNTWLWKQYAHKKEWIKEKSGNENEQWLFHGTSRNDPMKIYKGEHGFDMRHCSSGMWGLGTYFAQNASYSGRGYCFVTPQNTKQIFLARVALGSSIQHAPDSSLRMPPLKNSGKFTDERFDSVTGNTKGSNVFIVYSNSQAYPEYLITFT